MLLLKDALEKLCTFMEEEVQESGIELIRCAVHNHKEGNLPIHNPTFKTEAKIAIGAVRRIDYGALSEIDKKAVNYLIKEIKPVLSCGQRQETIL